MQKTLFNLVVPSDKAHPSFEALRTAPVSAPTRAALDDVYQDFEDPDGNFLEQFQTTGFDTRYFELYLHAYFTRSGFKIDRMRPYPDFMVSRLGTNAAIEATTINPSTSGVLAQLGKSIDDLKTSADIEAYTRHELAIRFGGPLFSKMQKRYWELDHVKGMPFVLAIEAFHDKDAHRFADTALVQYLYGLLPAGSMSEAGKLEIEWAKIAEHEVGVKKVPSNFFDQPDAEHVSAIVFTNAGTQGKFSRMGFQSGVGNDVIHILRQGLAYDPDPNAMIGTFFSYSLDFPSHVEPWGEGLVVIHNPRALHPLPKGFFVHAVDTYLVDGMIASDGNGFHPIASRTVNLYDEHKAKLRDLRPLPTPIEVYSIPKEVFREIVPVPAIGDFFIREEAWLTDATHSFLGVVTYDRTDNQWNWAVLARDHMFQFRAIEQKVGLSSREEAASHAQLAIAEFLRKPKRIFRQ